MSQEYLAEHLPAFLRALEIADREARALEASWQNLNDATATPDSLDKLEPGSPLAINIEAFAARFARLQDHLGEKLLPRLLLLLGEIPGPVLDTLNRAERLGIVEDALEWLAWRKLRNRLVHEYFQEVEPFVEALSQAMQAAPKLVGLVEAIRFQAKKARIPV